MKNEPMILDTSDEAASIKTVTGWVSRIGRFWGDDERMARWDGCTHIGCKDCGTPIKRNGYTVCDPCLEKRDDARYAALPLVEWDGTFPVAIFDGSEYFFDDESVDEWCETHGINPDNLHLVVCEPQYLREIDVDYWCDELPEDGEPDDAVLKALDALNAAIRAHGPASWLPGKKRIVWAAETVSAGQESK